MKGMRLAKQILLGCGLGLLLAHAVAAHDTGNTSTSSKHSYANAVKLAQPSVVNIYVLKPRTSISKKKSRLGSGVIVSKRGYVLTNNHVIRNAIKVYVVLSDGDWIQEASNWFTPGVGGIVGNPSNMGHSMRSKSAPLLTIWCLWE